MKSILPFHNKNKATHILEVFLKNITHSLPQFIFWKNTRSVYLGCNQNYAELVGLQSAEDIIGKTDINLHEFSRYEAGDLPVYVVKFHLRELIEKVMALHIPAAQAKHLRFNLEWDKRLPRYVIGDSTRVQRILLNLISNAIKFTEEGAVTVGLRLLQRKNQRILIECSVSDTGIGIPADQQERIFNRFNRLHPAYQARYSGLGLGLALVKQFVEDLKGEIEVESQEQQGSIFIFRIPLKLAVSVDSSRTKPVFVQRSNMIYSQYWQGSKKKILVVEDNSIVQRAVKYQLEHFNVEVETADNGAQALKRIEATPFDLIILDIGLPDHDGFWVAKTIHQRQKRRHQPASLIVALSAHTSEEQKVQCLQGGMVKTFSKPLDDQKAEEILSLIEPAPARSC